MKRWGVFLFCLTLLFPQRSHALGYSHEPIYLGDPFMEAFVPEVRTLRALVILDGFKLDPAWREYATVQHYLVLRLNTDSYASDLPEKGKAAANQALKHALIRAQKLLVDRTGHGEIPNLPIVAMGFSRFSGIGQKIAAIFPGRLLCFLTGFGPKGTKALAKDDLHARVPSQYLGNGWEDIYSESKKTTLNDVQWRRPPGAIRMVSMTWRTYHNPYNTLDLGFLFMDQVFKARVPDDWDPVQGPPKLKAISESAGWLGSHENWELPVEKLYTTPNENARIEPFGKFKGDKAQASWILNEELAWVWRSFNSRYPQVRVVAPSHPTTKSTPASLHNERDVQAGRPFLAKVRALERGVEKVELFANKKLLGTCGPFTGGEMGLGNTRDALCSLETKVEEPGVYALMARYTMKDGTVGWSNPAVLLVHP